MSRQDIMIWSYLHDGERDETHNADKVGEVSDHFEDPARHGRGGSGERYLTGTKHGETH
jgi:hypothetical protein